MQTKKLHIVSFDNPFPPVFGGVIDVFYKIKALQECGVEIYLHCYVDEIPLQYNELQKITKEIFFYKRNKSIFKFLSIQPFSIASRFHMDLLQNLNANKYPIFFEGLQSTSVIKNSNLKDRNLYLRLHNLEDKYYQGLAKSESNFFKKVVYILESNKYKRYKDFFKKFEKVFTVSNFETKFIQDKYDNAKYIPVFHGNPLVENLSELGNYALFNGDLRISDNRNAALFLIKVFEEIKDFKLVIASSISNNDIESKCKLVVNSNFITIKNSSHLDDLLKNAQINVMLSFQQSGTKLKVVNALYKSRFCIINRNMIDDLKIISLCSIAETKSDFVKEINKYKTKPYLEFEKRKGILHEVLNDKENALAIMATIWK